MSRISGRDVFPIVEGGRGVSISDGETAGAFAAMDCVGTVSVVNPGVFNIRDLFSDEYSCKTREERNEDLIKFSIEGAIKQIKIAYEKSGGKGRIHINALWEMASVEKVLHEVMNKVKGLVHGITCGAGLPYKLAEIASKYKSYYYPIVSSSRAFQILYKRSYSKFRDFLGGVVYEHPWTAGGHIGISNAEDPLKPESPFTRIKSIRDALNSLELKHIPIIIAGGIWWLSEWQDYINNSDIGEIAFQFGTRPLLVQESPILKSWYPWLMNLKKDDIVINKYSPTGFLSSAINNNLLKILKDRSDNRQFSYSEIYTEEFPHLVSFGRRQLFFKTEDMSSVMYYSNLGFNKVLTTPSDTVVLVSADEGKEILADQSKCVGCLSYCKFSNWNQKDVGYFPPDPRSFCIQKTLQKAAQGIDLDNSLIFAGSNAYRFAEDPFYENGFVPTIKELVERILTGY